MVNFAVGSVVAVAVGATVLGGAVVAVAVGATVLGGAVVAVAVGSIVVAAVLVGAAGAVGSVLGVKAEEGMGEEVEAVKLSESRYKVPRLRVRL